MNNNDMLNKLLGIPKIRVAQSVFVGEDQLNLLIESALPVASCPECGHLSDKIHDLSDPQMIRDLPLANRRCYLSYRARRFKCEPCQKTFSERVEWKRSGVSYTERYEQQVYQRIRRETVSQVAHDESLSEEATQALFEYWAKKKSKPAATRQ